MPRWVIHNALHLPVGSFIAVVNTPFRLSAVGTVVVVGTPKMPLYPSQEKKKKALSFTIGPPSVAPYWFWFHCGPGCAIEVAEEIVGVKDVISEVLVSGAVERVGAAFGGHVHHTAAKPSEFRADAVAGHTELLNGILGGNQGRRFCHNS